MYAIPGLVSLITFIYLRPQEVLPALQGIPFLYIFLLLTVLGWALDVRLGITKLKVNPILTWATIYFAWSGATLIFTARTAIVHQAVVAFVPFFLFAALAQGIQSFKGVRLFALTLLGLSLVLAGVGLHQATAPLGCVKQDDTQPQVWHADGRTCTNRTECVDNTIDDDTRFRCEHLGLGGTMSVEGRVRYRGIMEDPNELAMALSVALPFAFALFQSRRSSPRLLLAAAALSAFGLCTIFTQSRSGQLAFLGVLGIYLLWRLGWLGLAAAGVLGAPVLLLGGRADAGADQSTMERIGCWATAIDLFKGSPLVGVGKGQFTEHHYLTAHNSFLLALAETGFPGLFLFTTVVYLAFKATFTAGRLPGDSSQAEPRAANVPITDALGMGRVWGHALFASLCALVISAFFLSLTDHNVVWIYLGLAAAVASAAHAANPQWKLRFTVRDALAVGAIDVGIIVATFVYTRIKGV